MTNTKHTSEATKTSGMPHRGQHESLGIDFAMIFVILMYVISLFLHVWSS